MAPTVETILGALRFDYEYDFVPKIRPRSQTHTGSQNKSAHLTEMENVGPWQPCSTSRPSGKEPRHVLFLDTT